MGRFWVIWCGHTVTLIGNSVLRFAFVVQAWTSGGQAIEVVLLAMCALLPQVLLSPTAGALVDRLGKRTALQVADAAGLVVVGALTVAHAVDRLDLWGIYLTTALLGAAAALQYPALSSAVPLLVSTDRLQKANGLLATARSTADVVAPPLAATLIAVAGLRLILWVDLVSFVVALASIRLIRFTAEPGRDPGRPRRNLARESLDGLRHLFTRPSLRGLMVVVFTINLVMVFGYAVVQPMILARTGNDTSVLASVMTSIGVGGIAGGLLMGAWGGPRSRIRWFLLGVVGMCLSSQVAMAAAGSRPAWCVAIFFGALLMPVVNGTMQSIIQTKVPVDRQGRVFGAVLFLSQLSAPVAMLLAGVLADAVFEPQAAAGSGLVGILQPVVGTGPGSGMAAMLLLAGVAGIGAALWGMANRQVRDLDVLIPDLEPASERVT